MKAHHLLLAVALTLLPGSVLADTPTLREQSQQVVEARGLTGLRVENPRGLVQVGPSRDGRIHLTALKVTTSRMSSRADEFARETRVETSTESGRYVVRVRYPQRQMLNASLMQLFRGEFDLPRVEVRLALEVPPRLAVELETASGDLETSDLSGTQSLETTSGDVDVRAAAAFLSITTTSGNVVASGVGRARVRSVSGDVTLDAARGPLDVRTTSGNIGVSGVTDSLGLSSVSGDIRVRPAAWTPARPAARSWWMAWPAAWCACAPPRAACGSGSTAACAGRRSAPSRARSAPGWPTGSAVT